MNNNGNKESGWTWVILALGGTASVFGVYGIGKNRKNKINELINESKSVSLADYEDNIPIEATVIDETECDLTRFYELEDKSDKVKNILSTMGGNILELVLSKASLNGLLKCNVPIDLLTTAKDGAGMLGNVMENGRIKEQARFSRARMDTLTPLLAFQLASAITGQYYMHVLSKQLSELNDKVEWIINKLNKEEKSKFQRIKQDVEKYLKRMEYAQDECNSFIDDIKYLKNKILEYEDEFVNCDVLHNVANGLVCSKVLSLLNSNVDKCIEVYTKLVDHSYLLFLAHICRLKMLYFQKESEELIRDEFKETTLTSLVEFQNQLLKQKFISGSFMRKVEKEFFDSDWFTQNTIDSINNKWNSVDKTCRVVNKAINNGICIYIYCDETGGLKLLSKNTQVTNLKGS